VTPLLKDLVEGNALLIERVRGLLKVIPLLEDRVKGNA
jgi:hypothetical protein